jgi:Glycosyl hydrolase family 26/Carbohydrate binding module (family 35)
MILLHRCGVVCRRVLASFSVPSFRRFARLPASSALLFFSAAGLNAANYEAESAILSGAPAPSLVADGVLNPPQGNPGGGVSGGYLYFNTSDGNAAATFTVPAPTTGLYRLSIRFYVPNGFGSKFTRVLIDGVAIGETQFFQADATAPVWSTVAVGNLNLSAGNHTIALQADWGYYFIDYLTVDAVPAPPVGLKFEAENGVLSGGATVGTAVAGFSGTGYVTNFTSGTAKLIVPVNLAQTGQYRVFVGYRDDSFKNTRVLLNGADLGEWSLPASPAFSESGPFLVTVPAGVSVLEFQQDWGFYDLDYVRFDYVVPPVGLDFEAESGSLFRTVVATSRAGYSGTGYVTNFVQSPDATVSIPVNVAAGGAYKLVLRAASPFGPKMARIEVNGVGFGEASLAQSTTFTDFTGPTVFLRTGVNLITIAADWGFYDVDKIHLEPVVIPPFDLNVALVDPQATPEAVRLYGYLKANFGLVTLAGQAEEATATANRPFEYLLALTGKLPAVRDQDMIFRSSKGGWNDGTPERGIAWHKDQNGIVAMQWHWFAPIGPVAFYTVDSTFDITQAITPGTPEYTAALADIDLIAAELGKYAANHVPILWRPLHEAEGGWFWWGAKGPAPAKALYRLMFDRLVNHHGLHNLIWVWNSKNPAWYPGDDVVDIVSTDVYNPAHDYSPAPSSFLELAQLGGYRKLVTLAENGPIPNPADMAAYRTVWSWFDTWNGGYIMNDGQNESSHVIAVYHDPRVITLDELPDLRAPTMNVTRTGFVLNRRTGRVSQQVTVTSLSTTPLRGPVYLALDGLSSNTTLVNNGGTTTSAPAGSPYVWVSNADLAPGGTLTVSLEFTNPASGGITYTPRPITGVAAP